MEAKREKGGCRFEARPTVRGDGREEGLYTMYGTQPN